MNTNRLRRILAAAGIFLAAWLGGRFLLPFCLAALVALAAEPVVRRLCRWLPRPAAAGVGVTLTLAAVAGLCALGTFLAVRKLGPHLPEPGALEAGVYAGVKSLPGRIQPLANRAVTELLQDGVDLRERLAALPQGVVSLATALTAVFLISARLPELKQRLAQALPGLGRVKKTLAGWLKAQALLTGLTYAVTALALSALGVQGGVFWALPVAAVDALPMLGTGVILLPWAAVALWQGQRVRALGLGAVCLVTLILRRLLEPKLVGRYLQLDPLVTLVFFYAGYRLWGVLGMAAAPVLAAVAKGVLTDTKRDNGQWTIDN